MKENGITPLGIATNVVFIQSNPPSNIQFDESLSPAKWFQKSSNYIKQISDLEEMLNENYFWPFLQKVSKEVSFDKFGEPHDHVEEKLLVDANVEYVWENSMCKIKSNLTTCVT